MRWTNLVTLMDAEATRQEQANDHPAAILLREGAEALRKANLPDVGPVTMTIQERRGNAPFKGERPTPMPDPRRDAEGEKAPEIWRGPGNGSAILGPTQ